MLAAAAAVVQVGGHAVGILGQLNRSSSSICMLVRRWAPPLEDEVRVLPATAGSSSLCQILLLYPSFLRACISHLTIAPTRTMVHAGGSLDAVQVPASKHPTDRGGV